MEMLKPKDGVRLKVQYRPEEFTKVKSLPGDSFYIRYQGPGLLGIQGQGWGFLRRLVLMSVSETQGWDQGPCCLGPKPQVHGEMLMT